MHAFLREIDLRKTLELPSRRGSLSSTRNNGSSSFVVLSNKVKATRTGLGRQLIPTDCLRYDFLGETSLNAVLHWSLGGSTQWLSTGSAGEPTGCATRCSFEVNRVSGHFRFTDVDWDNESVLSAPRNVPNSILD